MGEPRKHRPSYHRPKKPFDKERLAREKVLKKEFGIRRKKEIWRAEQILRTFRQRARVLQAASDLHKQKELLDKVNSMGMTCASLDDVLEISLNSILSRRLQTVVCKKGLASTVKQARQLIVHGHIRIEGKRALWPSLLVGRQEEDAIKLDPVIAERLIVKKEAAAPAEGASPEAAPQEASAEATVG
ncbi:MAG: 30S ribosomal protein S4 [Candidatus Aenigmarchaeota archaeon]|nr:30S ribosomal protein S4 [Candidatus Aenigmarchaeota archaeon]